MAATQPPADKATSLAKRVGAAIWAPVYSLLNQLNSADKDAARHVRYWAKQLLSGVHKLPDGSDKEEVKDQFEKMMTGARWQQATSFYLKQLCIVAAVAVALMAVVVWMNPMSYFTSDPEDLAKRLSEHKQEYSIDLDLGEKLLQLKFPGSGSDTSVSLGKPQVSAPDLLEALRSFRGKYLLRDGGKIEFQDSDEKSFSVGDLHNLKQNQIKLSSTRYGSGHFELETLTYDDKKIGKLNLSYVKASIEPPANGRTYDDCEVVRFSAPADLVFSFRVKARASEGSENRNYSYEVQFGEVQAKNIVWMNKRFSYLKTDDGRPDWRSRVLSDPGWNAVYVASIGIGKPLKRNGSPVNEEMFRSGMPVTVHKVNAEVHSLRYRKQDDGSPAVQSDWHCSGEERSRQAGARGVNRLQEKFTE